MVRLIAADMDGTLLDENAQVPEETFELIEALRERGYTLTFEAPTNQVFVTLDHPTIERLQAHVRMGFMEKADNEHTVMRLCTSWATTDEQVDQLIALL